MGRILGVTVDRLYVRHMKTRWGSSNPRARSIRKLSENARLKLISGKNICRRLVVLAKLALIPDRNFIVRSICKSRCLYTFSSSVQRPAAKSCLFTASGRQRSCST